MSDDEQLEPAPASEPAPDPVAEAEGRSPALAIAVVAALIFAATTVVLAFVAVSVREDSEGLSDQQDLELAASRFAQAFHDRDADLASLEDDVVPLSVDPFLEQFQDGVDELFAFSESLGHQSTRVTIQDVYTTSASGDAAQAIVVFDAVATFADGRTVTSENQYLRLGLVRVDDEWKVNDVADLLASLPESSPPTSG